MFKSQLQEYAQKARFSAPVYNVWREGPSHEPQFRATVTIQGETYESPTFCTNLKSAQHAAARAALIALGAKSGSNTAPNTLHESGLCKSLLQEYTQKRKLPLPLYTVVQQTSEKHTPCFCASVEIGGNQYKGAVSRNRKHAEILAAKAALIAIYADAGQQASLIQQNAWSGLGDIASSTSKSKKGKRKKPTAGQDMNNNDTKVPKLNNKFEKISDPQSEIIPGITVTNLKVPEQDSLADPTLIPSPNSNNEPLQFSGMPAT